MSEDTKEKTAMGLDIGQAYSNAVIDLLNEFKKKKVAKESLDMIEVILSKFAVYFQKYLEGQIEVQLSKQKEKEKRLTVKEGLSLDKKGLTK